MRLTNLMNITSEHLQFMHDNPGYVVLGIGLLSVVVYMAVLVISDAIPAITIWFRGYPPPHCDASGDAIMKEEDED